MASENIGALYPTKIPGYDDAADIQAALRLYHYGSETYNPDNTDENEIPLSSIAGHLQAIEEDVAALFDIGIGSEFVAEEPSEATNGFIWVDSDGSFAENYSAPSALYQNEQPTTGLFNGLLWVDKDSSPLKMYVYDSTDEEWKEIGA